MSEPKTTVNHHLKSTSGITHHVTDAGGAWLAIDGVTLFLPTLVSLEDKVAVVGRLEDELRALRLELLAKHGV